MKQNPTSDSGIFNPRVLLAFALCSVGAVATVNLAGVANAQSFAISDAKWMHFCRD